MAKMRRSVQKAKANEAKKAQMLTPGSLAKGDSPRARKQRAQIIEDTYGTVPIR